MAGPKLYIVVRCVGHKSLKLRRGQTLRIGRHQSNDLVLNDGAVSRFHCAIVWDKDEDRPWIVDNESANGVEVDGREVDGRYPLIGDNQIAIGDFTVALQLRGTGATKRIEAPEAEESGSALIDDEDEAGTVVRLFSEKGGKLKGRVDDTMALHRLLVDLEAAERTGTLEIRDGVEVAKLMFGMGMLITCSRGEKSGIAALGDLLQMEGGSYSFSTEAEPTETSMNLSIKEHLMGSGTFTTRMVKRPERFK
jgi:pSer/pThr/pTyr-binding forkhead associated (FHA) protein